MNAYRASPQQEVLLLQQTAGTSAPWQVTVRVAGALDQESLQGALAQVIARHEILRTTLCANAGVTFQQISAADPGAPSTSALQLHADDRGGTCMTLHLPRTSADQISLLVCLAEISAAHAGQRTDAPLLQYADATDALHSLVTDPSYAAAQQFWRSELQDMAATRQGAQRLPRVAEIAQSAQEPRQACVALELARIHAALAFEGTREELLLALWLIFVARLGSAATTVGAFSRMREVADLGNALGPYDVMFPITLAVPAAQPLALAVVQVMEKFRQCRAYAAYLDPRATVQRLDFGFSSLTLPRPLFADPAVTLQSISCHANVDLELQLLDGDRITLACRAGVPYDVQAIAQTFTTWCATSLAQRAAPSGATPLLFEHEAALLQRAPRATEPAARIECLEQQIALQAAARPDACAVREPHRSLSFAELERAVTGLMMQLQVHALPVGTCVAIHLPRSSWWAIASLACWRLGLVIVPIDVNEPAARVEYIVRDARARMLLTQTSLQLDDVVTLDPAAKRGADSPAMPRAHPLAYILYTSGSTGTPKGVAVTHHSLRSYLSWAATEYEASSGGALVHSAFSFDFTLTSLWLPLLHGHPVEFLSQNATLQDLFVALTAQRQDAFVKLTPGHLVAFATMERELGRHIRWPRHLVAGGAALNFGQLPHSLRSQPVRLHNEYGPTEATVGCSDHCVSDFPDSAVAVPIGGATPGSVFHVLDDYLNPTPPGEIGELYIGGEQLAQCYVGKPGATARSFLPDPFARAAGTRMYRTGDLVRLAGGNLEFIGRRDHQVKRAGYRIELAEIDSELRRHPQVAAAHSVVTRPGSGEPVITSFCVGSTASEVRAWLGTRLPAHLLPNDVVQVPQLWLNANGKVDEARLLQHAAAHKETLSPANTTEQVLHGVWCAVLGRSDFGVTENFFNLGGDSIRAIQVVAQAGMHGVKFSIQDLFQHRTIRALAQASEACLPAASTDAAVFAGIDTATRTALQAAGIEDAYPISQLQLGMIYHNDAGADAALYHDIFSYRVAESIDVEMLRAAIRGVMQRHPALRTTFDLASYRQPLQLVWAEGPDPLTVFDVRTFGEAEQQRRILDWIAQEKARGFELSALPLVRFVLHLRGTTDFQFTTSFHHAVLDGWSDQILHKEILDDYRALQQGVVPPHASPASRYRDFVAQEQQTLQSAAARSYWQDRVRDYRAFELERLSPACSDEPAYCVDTLRIDPAKVRALQQLALQAGVPLKSVLLAAHVRVLSLAWGQADVTTSIVSSGRLESTDGHRVLGLFINSLPLRVQLTGEDWLTLIGTVYRLEQEMLPVRRFAYSELQRLTHGKALTPCLFYYTHYYESVENTGEIRINESIAHEESSFPLVANFSLAPRHETLTLRLTRQTRQVCARLGSQFLDLYQQVLTHLCTDPAASHARASLLPQSLHTVLHGSRPATPLPQMIECFEQRVRAQPQRIALLADRTLTYRQLDQHARRIAHLLSQCGVTPGSIVALCLQRHATGLAAMLAVTLCGAAFVPLDASYPPARLADMCTVATHIVCEPATRSALGACQERALLELSEAQIAAQPATFTTHRVPDRALAYVLHTSGSTGKPKAVMIEQRSLANLLADFAARLEFTSQQTFLAATSLSFDISLLELLLPLACGGKLVLAQERVLADVDKLVALLDGSHGPIDCVQATPTTWAVLKSLQWQPRRPMSALCGGEALSRSLGLWLTARFDGRVWNVYGPTETCIWSAAGRITDAAPEALGAPIAGTQLYVLDDFLHPVPPGGCGEIFIGGIGVSRGYAANARLTAQRFLPDPWCSGERMYRTGDLARVGTDGELRFSGRRDQQIKLRGQRIELEEVAEVLRRHPEVAEALAIVRRCAERELLLAYVVARTDPHTGAPAIEEHALLTALRAALQQSLPAGFQPAHVLVLDSIPKTLNHKTDYAALPLPHTAGGDVDQHVPTASPMEELLAAIWRDVLRLQRVSAETTFADLGASSLDVMQIIAKLRRELQLEVPIKGALEHPTVRSFARHLLTEGFAPEQVQHAQNVAKIWLMRRNGAERSAEHAVYTVD